MLLKRCSEEKFMKKNKEDIDINSERKKTVFREYLEAIIIALILALFIRAFVVQAFKIPSGSMENTLLIGDHILVNKFSYGIKIPNKIFFSNTKLFGDIRFFEEMPERGDTVVFEYPKDENRDFIKRVVGLPGEVLEIKAQTLYMNGKPITEPYAIHRNPYSEDRPMHPRDNYGPVVIPKRKFFVMGDNRENSQDSRYWNFLDMDRVKGKAFIIYWSWNSEKFSLRWNRLAKLIK